MRPKTFAIELRRDRLDVALYQGERITGARRREISLGEEPHEWLRSLSTCAAALQEMVAELGAEGARATVFYSSPSLAVDLISNEASSGADALRAAMLTCHDAASYSFDLSVADANIVARDRTKLAPRRHVLAAVERDDVAARITALIEQCGLQPAFLCPSAAPIISRVARQAVDAEGDCSGILYVGEHTSFFAIAGDARIAFGRRVRFGLDQLIRSLTLEIPHPESGDPVGLAFDRAASILLKHGIPERGDVVDSEHQLLGAHIMPSMQPALQRFVVELRQSLRFGLDDRQRDRLNVTLSGPGGRLPGLANLLAEELGVCVAAADDAGSTAFGSIDPSLPCSPGSDLHVAIDEVRRRPVIRLLPRGLASRRRTNRFRRCAWSGAVAALGLIAFDAVRLNHRITEAEKAADNITQTQTAHESLAETREQLIAFRNAVTDMKDEIEVEMAGSGSFVPFMRELALQTPPNIRIDSVTLLRDDRGAHATIVGVAAPNETGDAAAGMSAYFDALNRSPLIESLELKHVQSYERGETGSERFEVGVTLIPWSFAVTRGEMRTTDAETEQSR